MVAPVLTVGAKSVTTQQTKAYAAKRKREAAASAAAGAGPSAGAGAAAANATAGGAAAGATPPTAAGAAEGGAAAAADNEAATTTNRRSARVAEMTAQDAADHELAEDEDDSWQLGPTFMEGADDDDLEEDEKVGGLLTAIKVWATAIQYLSDIHATLKSHFDMVERKAHADKCAASGKEWALTINEHTSNKALWQYVHDAFAHIHEDIMEHGSGDRNDDAILEKGNRCDAILH